MFKWQVDYLYCNLTLQHQSSNSRDQNIAWLFFAHIVTTNHPQNFLEQSHGHD